MTVLPWPANSKDRRSKPAREPAANLLPDTILDYFVSSLPAPPVETEAERVARVAAQRAEILSYRPRNAVEAMMATQCILLGLVSDDARRDADRQPAASVTEKKVRRVARQLSEQTTAMHRLLVDRQSKPLGELKTAVLEALGMGDRPAPEPLPRNEASSAVIVPLHPAPKTLQ